MNTTNISFLRADKNVIEDVLTRLINKETLKNFRAKILYKDGSIKDIFINSNELWKDNTFVHNRCFTSEELL